MRPSDGSRLCREAILDGQKPDPILSVDQWADRYRVLSPVSSAEPGLWRTDRTPYLREIMECLSSLHPAREVVFQKGSQLGGTEVGLNWIGYIVDHSPGPLLVVQPTEGLAKRFSKQRIDPLFQGNERFEGKIRQKKSRDSGNTQTMKDFNGGIMVICGANSAAGLRSMPVRYVMLDEIDAYPEDVDGEGDPVNLAEARTRTFARRKIYKCSSPTIANRSRIEAAYESSDQRKYYVPCPHCDFYQVLVWDRVRWEKGKPETAHYVCSHCETPIPEHHKTRMLERGKWVAENKDKAGARVVGFQLSSLYSPLGMYSWADAAREFLDAKDNPLRLRVFVNTVLGETWKEKGEAPEWHRLFERREPYRFNVVPKGGLMVVAGVDVQKDRFELEIVAYGQDKQSWSLDYRVIEADTSDVREYSKLDLILNETFEVEGSKARLPIRLMGIDSGFNTQVVYEFVRNRPGRVIALKGSDNQQSLVGLPSVVDISYGGRRVSRGVRVWPVGVTHAKTELYGWLNLEKPTAEGEPYPPGYCHFPEYPEEFFKMLTAEQIVVRTVRGYRKYIWEKIRERNEALDARIYSRVAAAVVGLDRFTENDWNSMRDALVSKDVKRDRDKVLKEKGGIPTKPSSFWD